MEYVTSASAWIGTVSVTGQAILLLSTTVGPLHWLQHGLSAAAAAGRTAWTTSLMARCWVVQAAAGLAQAQLAALLSCNQCICLVCHIHARQHHCLCRAPMRLVSQARGWESRLPASSKRTPNARPAIWSRVHGGVSVQAACSVRSLRRRCTTATNTHSSCYTP